MNIGIDLGTTFSVIAVKGNVRLVDGYPPPRYLEECDVTIIPSPEGDYLFPSVFWENPDDGSILLGTEAKQKAEEGVCPIMFSKRDIGTDKELPMNDRVYTAKEVATRFLGYLKSCAEMAIGRPVTRAVVTHPAYFDLNQVQETREAAIAAGFDMSLPDQMMMEPAAAALAYIQGDERDPLRVMTYDLGGGTFDVTVLERSGGVITMRSFEGNHLLGGYNFDRELTQWLLNRLNDRLAETGRTIPYDDNNPEDRGRRARLLQLAESIKIRLTEQRSSKVYVNINAPDILVDSDGRRVQLTDKINREEYSALIKEHLDETISRCHAAVAKAGLEMAELDAVLMVGGSTYGQWVTEALRDAFGVDVEPYNPDICVAAGAAIKASEIVVDSGVGVEVIMDTPATCPAAVTNVSGRVKADDHTDLSAEMCEELSVLLTSPMGDTREPCPLNPEGRFFFSAVPLLEDEISHYTLRISDRNGMELFSKSYTIEYTPEGGSVTDIVNSVPKSLYLKTAEGMKLLAEEGEPLPVRHDKIELKRLHSDTSVQIPVYLEDRQIGAVRIDGIPEDAGEGCPIELTVEITQKNEMRGVAKVLSRTRSVAAQSPVQIGFPPLVLPGLAEMRADFDELKAHRDQLEVLSDDAEQRLLLTGQGRKLVKKVEKLFAEQSPDQQEIHSALKELRRLVFPPPDDLDPPRSEFRRLIEECDETLDAFSANPDMQPLRNTLRQIEQNGQQAFSTKNRKMWSVLNDNLRKLQAKVEKVSTGGGGGADKALPLTPVLKDHFSVDVEQLRMAVAAKRRELMDRPEYETKFKPRCDDIERGIDQMLIAIEKVDDKLESSQALAQLQLAARAKRTIQDKIPMIDFDTK